MGPQASDAASVAGSAAASCGPVSTGTGSSATINIDPNLRKCLAEVNTMLAIHVSAWMKKRGKSLRPKPSDEQKKQLEECYELMDADGSGAIDADELGAAFKLLGIDVTKSEISEMLDEVDEDGSGEVEYPEFIEIMTSTLSKLAHKKEEEGEAGNQVPFALLATAYRRKRIMEGLISGDREVMSQVTAFAEQASRRAAEEAQMALQQQRAAQAKARKQASNAPSNLPSTATTPKGTIDGNRSSIFRSPNSSHTGSIEHPSNRSSDTGAAVAAAAAAAAAVPAAGDARTSQVAAQAHIPTGLLRALQHVKSFVSTHSGGSSQSSALPSPTNSAPGSKGNIMVGQNSKALLPGGAAGGGVGGGANPPWVGSSGNGLVDEMLFVLPVEAIAGVLDLEEQRQLISILRAKTCKRLETVAATAAAAGHPEAPSLNPSRWPTASGAGPQGTTAGCATANGASCGCGGGAGAGASRGAGVCGTTACAGAGQQAASELEGLVGAKHRMTSKLMLKLLTQQFEPPKFALPSPAQRSSGSTTPTLGLGAGRGSRSANSTPTPYRQPAAAAPSPTTAAAADGSRSPQRLSAAAAALEGSAESGVAAAVASGSGNAALRKGINFGDTHIYEFDSTAGGSGSNGGGSGSNSRSGSRTRGSSWRSSGRNSEGNLLDMTRSKSLGELNLEAVFDPQAPAAAAAAAVGPRGANKPVSKSPSSKSVASNSTHVSRDGVRSPARSTSVHKPGAAADAARQQVGLSNPLTVTPKVQQQQQQQFVPVPQLPKVSGSVHMPAGHSRSKSGSPACNGSTKVLPSAQAAAAAVGKFEPGALQPSTKRVL